MNKPDLSTKKVISIYNQAWAEWILQRQQIKVEAELSGEFQFVARATDSLLQVNSSQGRFLVLTELQFRYDSKMPRRLAAYAALARQKYDQDVYITVIYFMPPSSSVTVGNAHHREFMGQLAHQDFHTILLWELDAEQVIAYNNPALLPFVPLMRGGNSEKMLQRCAERIRQEPEAAELETILAVFAEYVLDRELIKQLLRWEMAIVKESSIIQELIQEGYEEGERKATLEALYQTLTIRFKVERGLFDEQFERLEVETLKRLNEVALSVESLDAFQDVLTNRSPELVDFSSQSDEKSQDE